MSKAPSEKKATAGPKLQQEEDEDSQRAQEETLVMMEAAGIRGAVPSPPRDVPVQHLEIQACSDGWYLKARDPNLPFEDFEVEPPLEEEEEFSATHLQDSQGSSSIMR